MSQSVTSPCKRVFSTLLIFAALTSTAQAASVNEYRLAAGDQIRVQVFQNPDLALDTRVGESGFISYPLIGKVKVGGLPLESAETLVAAALKKGGYVQQPQVNISLLQVRGNQASVLGQVNRPGRFPLETTTTSATDLLAQAGGVAPGGADTMVLTGMRDGKPFRSEIDLPALYRVSGQGAVPDAPVMMPGDVLYVDRAPVYYIYGEAQRPGAFRIERGMTVQQALAQGGGPTPRGTEWRLSINRKGADGKMIQLNPALSDLVQADDVIYVRESLF
ncbi:polysaccharide export protein EpsE [Craterilacuibacter sp. RT1T]|uniref:polysaccharide export protein EpsE n=1 Tax=Craterilacuibacter sp. RT1T TaxID=2942211 RepID=UPI0020C063AB|nr:polysaccharide export protein EpsE [Craterilacuibacter sp. RT1T]MCL6262737.1 polysaccharide export protein EpsE [Craterilacuibacter sp. RT1T]